MKARQMNPGLEKALRISDWLKARHERQAKKQRQLAFHYLAKSGVFPDARGFSGYHFHLLHNWILGVESVKSNPFAHKALAAWNRVGHGHYARESRLWVMAFERYYMKGTR
jgi:hypothetical protein